MSQRKIQQLTLQIHRGQLHRSAQVDDATAPFESVVSEGFDRSLLATLEQLRAEHGTSEPPFPKFPGAGSDGCSDGGCGKCAVLVNGVAQLSCQTTLQSILGKANKKTAALAPLSKFPTATGLVVERQKQRDAGATVATSAAALSSCIECGICFEVCPNTGSDRSFVGPLRLVVAAGSFDDQESARRLSLGEQGVVGCHGAKNCTAYCPQGIDLASEIRDLNGKVRRQLWRSLFRSSSDSASSSAEPSQAAPQERADEASPADGGVVDSSKDD